MQWLLPAEKSISAGGNNTEEQGSQIPFLSTAIMKHLGSTFVPPPAKHGNEHILQLLLR